MPRPTSHRAFTTIDVLTRYFKESLVMHGERNRFSPLDICLIAVLLLLTTACGLTESTNGTTTTARSTSTETQAESVKSTINDSRLIAVPTQEPDPPSYASSIAGQLVEEKGCLWVIADHDDRKRFLVIWPYDYSASTDGRTIAIFNGQGKVVGLVGKSIYIGGGGEGPETSSRYSPPCEAEDVWVAAEPIHELSSAIPTPATSQ